MHHLALNRTGPHDRHFDHQVVITAGLQPRQHAHLGSALDLKHAHRVRAADHLVDHRIPFRNAGQRAGPPVMPLDQVETFANRRQHAQGQAVDLQDSQFIEIVLVPLDDRASRHRRVFDRGQLAQRAAGDHHAADVLGKMPRKANQLVDQVDQPPADVRIGIDSGLAAPLDHPRFVGVALHQLGQRINSIEGEAERFADIPHRDRAR